MANILCIDDEDGLREEIAEELRCDGHDVYEASSAREGLKIIAASEPDLILCDVTMPDQSGHEMLKDIRANYPEYDGIPFLFLTALAEHTDMMVGLELGADDYLNKPIDFNQLRLKIRSSLRLRSTYMDQIENISTTDVATGLPNRNGAEIHLTRLLDASPDIAVICFGLDEFKQAGGALTREEGFDLINHTADRLRQVAASRNAEEYVAFLENGTFLYIAAGASSSAVAEVLVRDAIDEIEKPFKISGQVTQVSVHAGICISRDEPSPSTAMIDSAMMALMYARQGNVGYRMYRSEMKSRARSDMKLKTSLRRALEQEEFFLEYQPQVDTETGTLVGAEALLRWRSAEQGIIPPSHFIPLAEQSRDIIPIGRWVLETAVAQAAEWQRTWGLDMRMAVNFSACQFQEIDVINIVTETLESANLDPEFLEIEITERMLLLNDAVTLATIETLLELGVHLSVDDFGTGYSSLGFLQKTPFSTVKIDRSFIENITSSNRDAVLVDTLIKMSHDLDMVVIAEGVETVEQMECLRRQNCEMIQGFLIGRPGARIASH